jgi:hypothetical protein
MNSASPEYAAQEANSQDIGREHGIRNADFSSHPVRVTSGDAMTGKLTDITTSEAPAAGSQQHDVSGEFVAQENITADDLDVRVPQRYCNVIS